MNQLEVKPPPAGKSPAAAQTQIGYVPGNDKAAALAIKSPLRK